MRTGPFRWKQGSPLHSKTPFQRGRFFRPLFLWGILMLALLLSTKEANAGDFFQPFDSQDWTMLGVTALADFADMDTSYSLVEHDLHVFNTTPRYGSTIPCPSGISGQCFAGHRNIPVGEGNPLITGLFGTRYPTALDYAAFGAFELGIQSIAAWAMPKKWRSAAFGVFIGIGGADAIVNSYGGGVWFRF